MVTAVLTVDMGRTEREMVDPVDSPASEFRRWDAEKATDEMSNFDEMRSCT